MNWVTLGAKVPENDPSDPPTLATMVKLSMPGSVEIVCKVAHKETLLEIIPCQNLKAKLLFPIS